MTGLPIRESGDRDPGGPGVTATRGHARPEARSSMTWSSMLMAGICGTDREILEGDLGYPPSGRDRLILGHEALGRCWWRQTEATSPGDLVVSNSSPARPCSCPNCAAGEWDMCRNGRFTEAGIRGPTVTPPRCWHSLSISR